MQVLVMYHSTTEHTKKLAEEIAKGVGEVEGIVCLVKPAADVTKENFLTSDAIIAGSPVYFGTMAAELKAVFERFVGVRKKWGIK
jgi:NAD(P)H dehydrogenase (quinone)